MATPFDRGVRAAQRRRLSTANPFLRRDTASYRRRAAEWAEGWASVTVAPPSPVRLLPVDPIRCPPGDYDRRERGLVALFLPRDPVEWGLLRAEMAAGVVAHVPQWARVPYAVLWAYATTRGRSLGVADPGPVETRWSHPVKYLWSAIRVQGIAGAYPVLVTSAYEELYGT